MIEYVIQQTESLDDEGEALYWSNVDGWGSLSTASIFEDIDDLMKPLEPCSCVPLPSRELGIL